MTDLEIERLGGLGILTHRDIADFSDQKRRIFALLSDRAWHTATEVLAAASAREGLRRLRDLRPALKGAGHRIARRRVGNSREWEYRIERIEPIEAQPPLFEGPL